MRLGISVTSAFMISRHNSSSSLFSLSGSYYAEYYRYSDQN